MLNHDAESRYAGCGVLPHLRLHGNRRSGAGASRGARTVCAPVSLSTSPLLRACCMSPELTAIRAIRLLLRDDHGY
jgi:hypothetical protein